VKVHDRREGVFELPSKESGEECRLCRQYEPVSWEKLCAHAKPDITEQSLPPQSGKTHMSRLAAARPPH